MYEINNWSRSRPGWSSRNVSITVTPGPVTVKLCHELHMRSVIDANLNRVRSDGVLIAQLRELRRRYVDFLIVGLRDPVEHEVTVAGILERICGDRVAIGIGSREAAKTPQP